MWAMMFSCGCRAENPGSMWRGEWTKQIQCYKLALSWGCLSNTKKLEKYPHRYRMSRLNNYGILFHTIHQTHYCYICMWSENSKLVLCTLKKYLVYGRERLQALVWGQFQGLKTIRHWNLSEIKAVNRSQLYARQWPTQCSYVKLGIVINGAWDQAPI